MPDSPLTRNPTATAERPLQGFMARGIAIVVIMMLAMGWDPQTKIAPASGADAATRKTENESATSSVSVPLSRAPSRLREILSLHDTQVDLRYVPSCEHFNSEEFGFYWRMHATKDIVESHIRVFYLAPAAHKDSQVKNMLAGLPSDWPHPNPEDLTWYAQGLGDDGNVGSWHVMGVDKSTEMLYFFVTSWDYAP